MDKEIAVKSAIENKILTVRNQQVMIDRDLAELYGVETKVLNQAVKRNINRFPKDFMFALEQKEKDELVTNCDRFDALKHSSTMPYAFTEQGVAMLSAVLKSKTAVQISIKIMNAFVAMRHFLQNNAELFTELKTIKRHQIEADMQIKETSNRVNELFSLMDKYHIDDTHGIFFQGQIFDAYAKFERFLRSAAKEIILIIDGKPLYHIGASLKDLGKKCFAFETLDSSLIPSVIKNL